MPDRTDPSDKPALRRHVERVLAGLSDASVASRSERVRRHLLRSGHWTPNACLLVFAALAREADLVPLLATAANDGVRLSFPRVATGPSGEPALALYAVESTDELVRHPRFGIREPDPSRCVEIADGDVTTALVPGLAFDPATGMRLGRGGGYYDRLFARPGFRALRIGTCFAEQLVRGIPCDVHDQAMDRLLTEDGWVDPEAPQRIRRDGR